MSFLMGLAMKTTSLINNFNLAVNDNFFQTQMDGGGSGQSGGWPSPTPATQSSAVAKKVDQILKSWMAPIFILIGSIGCIYIIIMAIQYAKAESDNKRAEVKTRLVNCVIGVISLLVIGRQGEYASEWCQAPFRFP